MTERIKKVIEEMKRLGYVDRRFKNPEHVTLVYVEDNDMDIVVEVYADLINQRIICRETPRCGEIDEQDMTVIFKTILS